MDYLFIMSYIGYGLGMDRPSLYNTWHVDVVYCHEMGSKDVVYIGYGVYCLDIGCTDIIQLEFHQMCSDEAQTSHHLQKWNSVWLYASEMEYNLKMGYIGYLFNIDCKDGVLSGHGLYSRDGTMTQHGLQGTVWT